MDGLSVLLYDVFMGNQWCSDKEKKTKENKTTTAETRRRQSFYYFVAQHRAEHIYKITSNANTEMYIVISFVQGSKHWLWYCIAK